jgi:ABC-type multidrug transport system ATPase subunit
MLNHLHEAIFHLFAILTAQDASASSEKAEEFLKTILSGVLSPDEMDTGLKQYQAFLSKYRKSTGKKGLAMSSVKFLKALETMRDTLRIDERHLLCIRLLEFVSRKQNMPLQLLDFVKLTSEVFSIDQHKFNKIYDVILYGSERPDSLNKTFSDGIRIIFLSSDEIYVKTQASETKPDVFFRLQYHQRIELSDGRLLIYSDILKAAGTASPEASRLVLRDLQYSAGNQSLFAGLSLDVDAPSLIAVMGQSGAGKSTLLKLIAGILKPASGEIWFSLQNPCMVYVPQEDSINPDIPVRQQIKLLAKKYQVNDADKRTDELLKRTGLEDKSMIKPGMPGESKLSGGERKRLAIACGLVSDPDVLLCDEPSSGLSFEDSERVIRFLRDAANQDCMVICSLHQPDAAVMSYFDNMLYLDKGGKPVYYGQPSAFESYVDEATDQKAQSVLTLTQNSSLARAESIVRQKRLDEFGQATSERRFIPAFWQAKFNAAYELKQLPEKRFAVGSGKIPFYRHVQYFMTELMHRKLFSSLLLVYAPVLAVLLALVCRFSDGTTYQPDYNPHFPVFFVMSILVALFSGLIFSLGEFSRQSPERKREWTYERTNHRFALARVAVLLPAGLFQAIVYSLISVLILQVRFLFLPLSLMYFVLWLFSSGTGLILSLFSRGKLWVYLIVPVLLIPQIIFSGAMIPWEKFPGNNSNTEAPFISHFFVASRAYEGLKTEAIYKHPDAEFEKERAYYLSLFYLQDVLPLWASECETHLKDEAAAQSLYSALPPEMKDNLPAALADNPQKLEAEAERIFTATLATQENMKKPFPALWYSSMKADIPAVSCLDGKLHLNAYPYYRTGSLLSPEAAYVEFAGLRIRHIHWSVFLICFAALIQFAFITSGKYKWPWSS